MAILGHVALGFAAGRAYHERTGVGPLSPLLIAGTALAALPDLDLLPRAFGIYAEGMLSHRGITHSFLFACVMGVAIGFVAGRFGLSKWITALFAAGTIATHGLADTLTATSYGPALFWPFSTARFVAPWRPVMVVPLTEEFFGELGLRAALRELSVFWPLFLYALYPRRRAAVRTRDLDPV